LNCFELIEAKSFWARWLGEEGKEKRKLTQQASWRTKQCGIQTSRAGFSSWLGSFSYNEAL